MSRSFYVDSLILNRSPPLPQTNGDHARPAVSIHHHARRSPDTKSTTIPCFRPHTDALSSCPLCVRDHVAATAHPCQPRLPPLTTTLPSLFKSPIPLPGAHHSSSHHPHHPHHHHHHHHHTASTRSLLEAYQEAQLRQGSLPLSPARLSPHHTPVSSHHEPFRPTSDPRRIHFLPVGKTTFSFQINLDEKNNNCFLNYHITNVLDLRNTK